MAQWTNFPGPSWPYLHQLKLSVFRTNRLGCFHCWKRSRKDSPNIPIFTRKPCKFSHTPSKITLSSSMLLLTDCFGYTLVVVTLSGVICYLGHLSDTDSRSLVEQHGRLRCSLSHSHFCFLLVYVYDMVCLFFVLFTAIWQCLRFEFGFMKFSEYFGAFSSFSNNWHEFY